MSAVYLRPGFLTNIVRLRKLARTNIPEPRLTWPIPRPTTLGQQSANNEYGQPWSGAVLVHMASAVLTIINDRITVTVFGPYLLEFMSGTIAHTSAANVQGTWLTPLQRTASRRRTRNVWLRYRIVLMTVLDALFWGTLLWALVDSLVRWRQIGRASRPLIHTYIPVHYLGAAVGVTLWALQIGNVNYDNINLGWLRSVAVALTLAGWLLTMIGRNALGQQWTPDVRAVAPGSRVASGPYALVKHPIYVGEAIFFLGVSMYLANAPTFVLLFIGGTLYNVYRASLEPSKHQ